MLTVIAVTFQSGLSAAAVIFSVTEDMNVYHSRPQDWIWISRVNMQHLVHIPLCCSNWEEALPKLQHLLFPLRAGRKTRTRPTDWNDIADAAIKVQAGKRWFSARCQEGLSGSATEGEGCWAPTAHSVPCHVWIKLHGVVFGRSQSSELLHCELFHWWI